MPLTLVEFQRRSAAIAASRTARERGDYAAAVAAWDEVEEIEAAARRRESRPAIEHRVVALEERLRELGRMLGNEAK